MKRAHFVDQMIDLSAPVILGLGMFLSGVAGAIGGYGSRLTVVLILLAAASFCYGAKVFVSGLDRAFLPILLAGSLFVFCIALILTVLAPTHGVDVGVLVKTIVQLVCVIGWIGYCSKCRWDSKPLWMVLATVGIIVMIANLGLWTLQGFPAPFGGFATAKNGLATAALVGVFVALGLRWQDLGKPYSLVTFQWVALLALSLLVVVASVGRTAMLSLALIACFGVLLPRLKTRTSHVVVFVLLLSSFALAPKLYVSLARTELARRLDVQSKSISNMSLFTGRETLWPYLISKVEERPAFGHGTRAQTRFIRRHKRFRHRADANLELSAHNLYLVTAYQTGLVGLLVLMLFLYSVWHALYDGRNHYIGRLAAAFYLAILFRENFEISLTQNNLQMGLGGWAMVASGLAFSYGTVRANSGDRLAHTPPTTGDQVQPQLQREALS